MLVWLGLVAFLFILRLALGRQDSKRKQKEYLIVSGAVIALVMGMRYPYYAIVTDLESYVRFYELVGRTPWDRVFDVSRFEYGYVVMNKLLVSVVPWSQSIVLFEAAFVVFCMAHFIYRNSEHAFLGMLYYVTLGTMAFHLTGFRQSFAMSICLLSIECIKSRQFMKFVLIVVLAATFHKSAIAFIPAYFLLNRKPNFANSVASIAFVLAGIVLADQVTTIGNRLLEMDYGSYIGNTYGGLVPVAIYVIVILITTWKSARARGWIGLNMTIIGLGVYLMRYVTLALERVSFYFTSGIAIALPEAINSEEDPRLRASMQVMSVAAAVALFAYRLTTSEWASYRFFWQ